MVTDRASGSADQADGTMQKKARTNRGRSRAKSKSLPELHLLMYNALLPEILGFAKIQGIVTGIEENKLADEER